ncbi:hypothetical protein ABZP36_030726 [Zizania latifolia]
MSNEKKPRLVLMALGSFICKGASVPFWKRQYRPLTLLCSAPVLGDESADQSGCDGSVPTAAAPSARTARRKRGGWRGTAVEAPALAGELFVSRVGMAVEAQEP